MLDTGLKASQSDSSQRTGLKSHFQQYFKDHFGFVSHKRRAKLTRGPFRRQVSGHWFWENSGGSAIGGV